MATTSATAWDLTTAKYSAFAAAGLTFIETALVIAYAVEVNREELGCNFDDIRALDATCLHNLWDIQHRHRFLQFGFEVIGAMAAFASIPPVLALAELFGKRFSSVKVFVPCFAASAGITAWGLLVAAGRSTTSDWIYNSFTLDDDNLRALTIATFVERGSGTWLFALDELLLGVALITISCLVYSAGQLPRWMAHLGAVGGVLAVVTFFTEVARFGAWQLLSTVAGAIAGFVGFIILPIWFIGLGVHLGSYQAHAPVREGLMSSDVAEWSGAAGAAAPAPAGGLELGDVAVSAGDAEETGGYTDAPDGEDQAV